MYRIKTMNKISSTGLDHLDKSRFQVGDDLENEDGILVRSAPMHDYPFPDALRAIARAGAGTNNIPIDRCSEHGIVVFNTPGANANAVKELVVAAMLIASRDLLGGADWVQEQAHTPKVDVVEAVEKGKVFLLGTDGLGRDLLSYLIYGARTSVILCIACTILSTIISTIIGVSSAVLGGGYDLLVQRLVDAWQCIPSMLILLILMVLMGNGMPQMIIAISVPGGIAGSRIIRSAAMGVKDAGYVKMSQMLGSNPLWEMVKHVLPNIMPIIIINMAGSLGGVVMMEASMNFLGYGVDVGTPSWGYLITNQGRDFMLIHPLLAIAPGVLIALMVFASAMFGDGVRDVLDPRLKGGVGSYSGKKLRRAAQRLSRKKAAAE